MIRSPRDQPWRIRGGAERARKKLADADAYQVIRQGKGFVLAKKSQVGEKAAQPAKSFRQRIEAAKPVREASTFAQAREHAKTFQGRELTNDATGMVATVSRNNLDKMLNRKAVSKSESPQTHSLAVANVDALFQRAMLGWSKPDAEGDPNIVAIHRFFAPMNTAQGARLVKLTVKETAQAHRPNPLYTVEAVEFNEKSPAAQWVGEIANADGVDPRTIRSAGDILSLAQEVQGFNGAEGTPESAPTGGRSESDGGAPRFSRAAAGSERRGLQSRAELESRAFFRGTAFEKGDSSPEQARADAVEVLGFDPGVKVETESRPDRTDAPMRYDLDRKVILYNVDAAHHRVTDVQYMMEEMLHALDHVSGRRTISASSSRWLPGGDLRTEIEQTASAGMTEYFEYPLKELNYSDTEIAAELFARAGVLYYSKPEVMAGALPGVFNEFEAVFRRGRDARGIRSAVRESQPAVASPGVQSGGESDLLRGDRQGARRGQADRLQRAGDEDARRGVPGARAAGRELGIGRVATGQPAIAGRSGVVHQRAALMVQSTICAPRRVSLAKSTRFVMPPTHVRGMNGAAKVLGISRQALHAWIAHRRPDIMSAMLRFSRGIVGFDRAALLAIKKAWAERKPPKRKPRPPQRVAARPNSATRTIVRLIDKAPGPLTLRQVHISSGCAYEMDELAAAARRLEQRGVLESSLVEREASTGRRMIKAYSRGPAFAGTRERYASALSR
ncbi:MAG: hypothetical protein QM766_19205 [Burkholderiaceae bacterium]